MSRRLENASVISDLCHRMGFAIDRDLLQTESGILLLLTRIQARLNQLQDEDTYRNVEEIPTDPCPVVHPEPPLCSKRALQTLVRSPLVNSAINSVMMSMILSQLRLVLTAQAIDSSSNSISPSSFKKRVVSSSSSSQQFLTVAEKSLSPLLTEIRSGTLLSEVLTSVVRVASEVVHDMGLPASRSTRCRDLSEPIVVTSPSEYRKTQQSRTSTASTKSSSSSSSFSGFPCYPSPRTSLDNDSESGRSGSRARSSTTSIQGFGQAKKLNDTTCGKDKRHAVTAAELAARLLEATSDTNSSSWLISNHSVQASSKTNDIVSKSIIEARWRDRPLVERRQQFCWPFEDAYRNPYENDKVIARDNWQFLNHRGAVCPPDVRLNRIGREKILEQRLQLRKREINQKGLVKGASSPFELLSGVTNPKRPGAAPCRAAFFGKQ